MTGAVTRQSHVANSLERLPARVVGELVPSCAISCSEDIFCTRLQAFVHLYAFIAVFYSRSLKPQALYIGNPTSSYEQQVYF
mmetsp:Transcript_40724/g.79910  ORF Transcript_40724/g.79910 Transcript_40724/m.79910 type:complete len:82 (+) Transcript_40724:608-853(+)